MCVPLELRGRTIGAISVLSAESGRRFGEAELLLARELARRASLAVENARLYRQAQETAASLDTLVATAPVGLAFWDLDFRYVRINEALAEINGVPREESLGRTLEEIIPSLAPTLVPLLRRDPRDRRAAGRHRDHRRDAREARCVAELACDLLPGSRRRRRVDRRRCDRQRDHRPQARRGGGRGRAPPGRAARGGGRAARVRRSTTRRRSPASRRSRCRRSATRASSTSPRMTAPRCSGSAARTRTPSWPRCSHPFPRASTSTPDSRRPVVRAFLGGPAAAPRRRARELPPSPTRDEGERALVESLGVALGDAPAARRRRPVVRRADARRPAARAVLRRGLRAREGARAPARGRARPGAAVQGGARVVRAARGAARLGARRDRLLGLATSASSGSTTRWPRSTASPRTSTSAGRSARCSPSSRRSSSRSTARVLESGRPLVHEETTDETPTRPGGTRQWLTSYYPVVSADGEPARRSRP